MKQLIPLGILIIFLGVILVVIGALSQSKADSKVAVGGFIGFIPFGFANDKRMLYFIIGLSAFLIIFWFILSNWR